MKKIIQEKKNFNHSKKTYYNHINTLLERIDKQFRFKEKDENLINNKEEFVIEQLIENRNKQLSREICNLCKIKDYLYICPKCKVKYCSLDCYKGHNGTCTEEFYKGNVIEELKSMKSEKEEVKKFKGNFRTMIENEADKEDKYPEFISESRRKKFETLLDKIDNNTLDPKKDLTPEDWREFKDFMTKLMNDTGLKDQDDYIQLWKPYWLSDDLIPSFDITEKFDILDEKSRENMKNLELNEFMEYYKYEENIEELKDLAEEHVKDNGENELIESEDEYDNVMEIEQNEKQVSADSKMEKEFNEKLFEKEAKMFIEINSVFQKINREIIIKSIMLKYQILPQINSLTKVIPNKHNLNTVVYLIGGIVYLFRLYNGDVLGNIDEIFQYYIEIFFVLYENNIIFNSVTEAINELFSKVLIKDNKNFESSRRLIYSDLDRIFEDKFYIIESLLRMYEVIHKFESKKVKKIYQRNLILSKHKLIYYLSYVKSLEKEICLNYKNAISEFFSSLNDVNILGNRIKKMNIINK